MSRYVEHGFFDCGLCGHDWVLENGSTVVEVCDLLYNRASRMQAQWVLAVPETSSIYEAGDLEGKRIATELVNVTKRYLRDKGVNADVQFSWGATEAKAPEMVDAIVELTETGSSLRSNRLRIVDILLVTNTKFIANEESWRIPWKRQKIEELSMLLQAALEAEKLVGLKLNCPKASVKRLLDKLPALRKPTVNRLADDGWVALDTVIEETVVREIIPLLKKEGAEGIIEYPLNKVVF
jgi:ATP phosphoribosyltransferase